MEGRESQDQRETCEGKIVQIENLEASPVEVDPFLRASCKGCILQPQQNSAKENLWLPTRPALAMLPELIEIQGLGTRPAVVRPGVPLRCQPETG
jgi:hypothetical protein